MLLRNSHYAQTSLVHYMKQMAEFGPLWPMHCTELDGVVMANAVTLPHYTDDVARTRTWKRWVVACSFCIR